MSDTEFEKYRAKVGDNIPAIFSYWDFAAALMTMSLLKSIAICHYWPGEINEIHMISILMCADAIIFLACPRWTNMYATTPVFAYLFHIVADMQFCDHMATSILFSPDRGGWATSTTNVIVAVFLLGLVAYCRPIYVCVAEWKESHNQSKLKKKE